MILLHLRFIYFQIKIFAYFCRPEMSAAGVSCSRGVQAARLEENFSEFSKWLECLKPDGLPTPLKMGEPAHFKHSSHLLNSENFSSSRAAWTPLVGRGGHSGAIKGLTPSKFWSPYFWPLDDCLIALKSSKNAPISKLFSFLIYDFSLRSYVLCVLMIYIDPHGSNNSRHGSLHLWCSCFEIRYHL